MLNITYLPYAPSTKCQKHVDKLFMFNLEGHVSKFIKTRNFKLEGNTVHYDWWYVFPKFICFSAFVDQRFGIVLIGFTHFAYSIWIFHFFMRNSVFSCPWKSFQLKSLHFLGMFLLMTFCENHSAIRRKASYISLGVRRCSDFVSLLQMLISSSRFLLIIFLIFLSQLCLCFLHSCGNVDLILLISNIKPALQIGFLYTPFTYILLSFKMLSLLKIPYLAQCLQNPGLPWNFHWLLNNTMSCIFLTRKFLQNSRKELHVL